MKTDNTALQSLIVWVRHPHGRVQRAGEIRTQAPEPTHGGIQGAFRYDPLYLGSPEAFALDPVHLRLADRTFHVNRPHAGVHGVFEDALPDAWGRALLARQYQMIPREQRVPGLLACLGGNALGALAFRSPHQPPDYGDPSGDLVNLGVLLRAAEEYEKGEWVPPDPRLLPILRAGSSPGGVRPKALVRDDAGHLYVAKFPSITDTLDMVRIEKGTMDLAQQAGLPVPETTVVLCGRRPVLLSRRFDVSPEGGRFHLISLQTLLGADGFYTQDYADVADAVSQISAEPNHDLPALYRQIVFHAFIGHTDDHLKNILMRHDEQGYHLAPAFDLAPDVALRGEHVLSFGGSRFTPDASSLSRLAAACRLSSHEGTRIISEVEHTVRGWDGVLATAGVSAKDRARLAPDLAHRLTRLSLTANDKKRSPAQGTTKNYPG
ncbi:MAG: type II toxin-antitoxin system HipA family toxin [Acidobacteriaceae bacterium]